MLHHNVASQHGAWLSKGGFTRHEPNHETRHRPSSVSGRMSDFRHRFLAPRRIRDTSLACPVRPCKARPVPSPVGVDAGTQSVNPVGARGPAHVIARFPDPSGRFSSWSCRDPAPVMAFARHAPRPSAAYTDRACDDVAIHFHDHDSAREERRAGHIRRERGGPDRRRHGAGPGCRARKEDHEAHEGRFQPQPRGRDRRSGRRGTSCR